VIENLVVDAEGDLDLRLLAKDKEIARANPLLPFCTAHVRL
jgi:hypothetical protein